MSNFYYPGILPEEYDQAYLQDEFGKLEAALSALEVPTVLLTIQNVEPERPQEGMVANADGVNWNPGHGKGLYEYLAGRWSPLFSLAQGFTNTQVVVENTTTEMEVYSTVLAAGSLNTESLVKAELSGSYDTGAASDTWTMRFKVGGTTIHTVLRHDSGNAAGAGWLCKMHGVVVVSGASGSFKDLYALMDNDATGTESSSVAHGIDTTVANTLSVTIQWGAAKAGNIFRLEHGVTDFQH